MRRRLVVGVIALMMLAPSQVLAQTAFYQPVISDQVVTESQWRETWRQLSASGVRQLVVQWTRYDSEDFGGRGGWLHKALEYAQQQNLGLVLGLHLQSDYRQILAQQQPPHYFWHHLLSQSRLQQLQLQGWGLQPQGWYLPYPLDDALYRSAEVMREIDFQLSSFYSLDQRPLHISARSTGQLAPRVYAEWLQLLENEQLQIWWQGSTDLPPVARATYQSLLPCDVGVIEIKPEAAGCHPAAIVMQPVTSNP